MATVKGEVQKKDEVVDRLKKASATLSSILDTQPHVANINPSLVFQPTVHEKNILKAKNLEATVNTRQHNRSSNRINDKRIDRLQDQGLER